MQNYLLKVEEILEIIYINNKHLLDTLAINKHIIKKERLLIG
jgi:hypothetical protein